MEATLVGDQATTQEETVLEEVDRSVSEDHTRMQEEDSGWIGKVNLKQWNKHVIVFQHWPSWYFALEGSGWSDAILVVPEDKLWMVDLIVELYPNATVVKYSSYCDYSRNFKENVSFWLQGDASFIDLAVEDFVSLDDDLHVVLEDKGSGRARLPTLTGRTKAVTWKRFSHVEFGGATAGKWSIGTSVPETFNDIKKSTIRRSLGDFLSCTEDGLSVGASLGASKSLNTGKTRRKGEKRQEIVWRAGDRLPTHDSKPIVVTKCVLKKSGFVKRFVQPKELCAVYDCSVTLQQHICSAKSEASLNLRGKCIDAITRSMPEKILCQFIKSIGDPANSPSDIPNARTLADILSEDPATVEKVKASWDSYVSDVNQEEEKNGIENVSGREVDSDSTTDPSHLAPDGTGVAYKWLLYEDEDQENATANRDLKAVKHDDADIPVEIWDSHSIASFKRKYPEIRHPLILKTELEGEEQDLQCKSLNAIRALCLRRYQVNLRRSFTRYLKMHYGDDVLDVWSCRHDKERNPLHVRTRQWWTSVRKDMAAGVDGITRALGVTPKDKEARLDNWWKWTLGSTLFFWRWHNIFRFEARDGTPMFIHRDKLPKYWARQQWPQDAGHREKLRKKVEAVVGPDREYISEGFVRSITGFFCVPKGEDDIRIVYDATKCQLNAALWAPKFFLPTIDTILRNSDLNAWFGDIDLGEMFLNFPLDPQVRPYAGVEVTYVLKPDLTPKQLQQAKRVFRRWIRCLMGLRPSPYVAIRACSWGEEIVWGDRHCPNNPLQWETVQLNLPGSPEYDPSLPWVVRRRKDGDISGYFGTYVDDIRPVGNSEDHCYDVARRIASYMNYLGMQDAARKRRTVSQRPGAWAGSIIVSKGGNLYVTTAQQKWDKCKDFVRRWLDEVKDAGLEAALDHKDLERGRGNLVYLCRTYPSLTPFLKGIHHTLDSWRPGRDKDGWKFNAKRWKCFLNDIDALMTGDAGWEEAKREYVKNSNQSPPSTVNPVERLEADLEAILFLMRSEKPPLRLARGNTVVEVIYGFGDAAGSGFGSSLYRQSKGVNYRVGVWGSDMDDSSSNFRELKNVVESIEKEARDNGLNGVELFFFTDNSTSERSFYKGSSSSRELHDLVTRLRDVEMNAGCRIHLCHVAGTRMIEQGTDGLSRGNLTEGVMQGTRSMMDFVPLHRSAFERSPALFEWIESWVGLEESEDLEYLTPTDWFERGHDLTGDGYQNLDGVWVPKILSGFYVWSPPPAAAEVALEELRKARHKRQESTHLFVCPRLMEPRWRSHVHKSADLFLEIPAGSGSYWPESMHEPLIIAFYFPYLNRAPWQLKNSQALLDVGWKLRQLWKDGEVAQRPLLQQLWSSKGRMGSL